MMAENEILLLQDKLYEYLKGLHLANPNFWFALYDEDEIGYWFLTKLNAKGNKSICTSFTEGFDCECHLSYDVEERAWTYSIKGRAWIISGLLGTLEFNPWRQTQSFFVAGDFLESLDFVIKNPIVEARLIHKPNPKPLAKTILNAFRHDISIIDSFKNSADGKSYYKLLAEMSKPHLPSAIFKFEISDFQGIKYINIDNFDINTQWIFLTGENGFGKTSLLRAIALGLTGDEYADQSYLTHSIIKISGCNRDKPFWHRLKPKELAPNNIQVATYGASRFRYSNEPIKNKKKTYPLFSDDAPLINIEDILIKAERAKSEKREKKGISKFDKLKQLFLDVIPQLVDIKVEYFENELLTDNYQVRYYEKSENGDVYEPVQFSDLAAGYRSILSIIGDMIVRLSAHPNNSLDDLQGIVLIDEFDAHLHPKYQYELPKLLSDAFPKVQFIVSTHSPIPILGVKPDTAVVLTVHRTKEAGITVERLDDDIEIGRLSANALLTSNIFNFKTIFARGATPDTLEPFDDYEEIRVKNRVEKLLELRRNKNNIKH
jgi:predicted ATPase